MLYMHVRVWHTGKLKAFLRADIPTSNLLKESNADHGVCLSLPRQELSSAKFVFHAILITRSAQHVSQLG